MFVVVYRPPGPYSEFLSEFSEFLSQLALSTDKVIVVGDFKLFICLFGAGRRTDEENHG